MFFTSLQCHTSHKFLSRLLPVTQCFFRHPFSGAHVSFLRFLLLISFAFFSCFVMFSFLYVLCIVGDQVHRPEQAHHPGGGTYLSPPPPRYLLHRGPGPAHPRPQKRQPERRGLRQARFRGKTRYSMTGGGIEYAAAFKTDGFGCLRISGSTFSSKIRTNMVPFVPKQYRTHPA